MRHESGGRRFSRLALMSIVSAGPSLRAGGRCIWTSLTIITQETKLLSLLCMRHQHV